MDISLTPHELRDLLAPMLRLRVPREPLDLDRMMCPQERALEDAADTDGLTAQRALVVTLADLAQAQEELARTRTIVEEKAEELRQLIENYAKVRQTPIMQANAVIERAGRQVLELAALFFGETGPSWYEGVRAGLAGLISTLGAEVEDEALEEFLKTREQEILDATPPATPPGFHVVEPPAAEPPLEEAIDAMRAIATAPDLASAASHVPTLERVLFGGRRSTLGADSEDLVPPAGPFESPNVVIEPKGDAAGPRASQCKHCGEELRLYPEGWIDAETHATAEDGHKHEPAEDATGDADDPEIFF